MTRKDINDKFESIFPSIGYGKFSKSARDNYDKSINAMGYASSSIDKRLSTDENSYLPEIDENVRTFYDGIISSFFKSWSDFVDGDGYVSRYEDVVKKTSPDVVSMFDEFNRKYSSGMVFANGDPKLVDSYFTKASKTLTKNGFSREKASDMRKAEDEAKKPKMPDKVDYVRSESFDSKRMLEYKPSCKGEGMALSRFLSTRGKQIYYGRNYSSNHPEIMEFLNDVFNALDNVWFSYVGGKTNELDFTEYNNVRKEWENKSPFVGKFESKMSSLSAGNGYSLGLYTCEESLRSMKKSREKFIYEVSGKKEDEYSRWEKSIDSILNDDGKPSLNTYLDEWVEDCVSYYTDKDNISLWRKNLTEVKREMDEHKSTMERISSEWYQSHRNSNGSWSDTRYGYRNDDEYIKENNAYLSLQKISDSLSENIRISNLGETGIRKMFREQADSVKKDFVTRVCSESGEVTDGRFYWSEQNTGHMNGWVRSDKGKFKVTSFFAGGYNIQRLHTRTKITKLVEN